MSAVEIARKGNTHHYRIRLAQTEHPARPRISFNKHQAEEVNRHMEHLVAAQATVVAPATQAWLKELPDAAHERLASLGLAQERVVTKQHTVAEWAAEYIAMRTDIKPRTVENLRQAERALVAFAGDTLLDKLTPGMAEERNRSH